jgi:protein tyrosine/serine phosphatase
MIYRFHKVDDGIYRGSAPSVQDVIQLHKNYGINKIISLDADSGSKINRICKLLNINHVNLPINEDKKTIINLLNHNIKKLLQDNGPTFVHCFHGKDRTGLVVALYEVKCLGIDPDDAIKEAEKLGFGIGVNPYFINLFKKIIFAASIKKEKKDENNLSIADNVRNNSPLAGDNLVGDIRDSYLDEGSQSSFAPFMSTERVYPFNQVYNYIYDTYPTRNNYDLSGIEEGANYSPNNEMPAVGLYDNSVIKGVGPVDLGNGFVNS